MTKLAVPNTQEGWEDFLTSGGLKNVKTKEDLAELTNAYRTAFDKKDPDVGQLIQEGVQEALANLLRVEGGDLKRLDLGNKDKGAAPSPLYNNPRATGAPLNGLFPDVYSFMQAIWHGKMPLTEDQRNGIKLYNEYSEKIPSEGGYLVPEEFRTQIMQLAVESSVVRPRAQVIPMNSPRLNLPIVDETSRVSSIFGGIIVYRTEEGAELEESAAAFASLKLDVTKQTALAHVTNELIRDWGAFGSWFDQNMPKAIGFFEDIDFLSGSGAGEPLGMLNEGNTAIITVSKESGQSATTIVWENILRMYARLLPSSYDTAVWIAAPNTFFELATMALSVGTGGSAVWITDAHGKPQLTLLGLPVILSEKAPAGLGTKGDLNLVDPNMYAIGDYQTMTIDSSQHVKFTSDKTTFRVIARNDGRPMLFSAITPHYNGDTLSPFVQLETRS